MSTPSYFYVTEFVFITYLVIFLEICFSSLNVSFFCHIYGSLFVNRFFINMHLIFLFHVVGMSNTVVFNVFDISRYNRLTHLCISL